MSNGNALIGRGHGGGGHGGWGGGGRRYFGWGGGGGYGYGYPYGYPYGGEEGGDVNVSVNVHPSSDGGTDTDDANPATSQDAPAVVNGWVDPLVREINRKTDERFWHEYNYKPGQRLNRNDQNDAVMIPLWLEIRYDVAREANLASEHAPQPAPAEPQIPPMTESAPHEEVVSRHPGNAIVSGRGQRFRQEPRRQERLVHLAPVLAPATRGMSTSLALDGNVVHVSICVDGKCYDGSADLSEVLGALDARFAAYHTALHARPHALVGGEPTSVVGEAVLSAGEVLIGALVDQHRREYCAGWWHDLTHKISTTASSIGTGVAHTLKALKAPISIAAAAGAAAVIGPQAGPMAAQMTGALIDAANGDSSAQAIVQQAQQIAQTNPQVAQVMQTAQQAVAQTTAAYHTVQTVKDAAQGNAQAQGQVMELAHAAANGDSSATQLMALASKLTGLAEQNTGAVGPVPDAASSGVASARSQAIAAVKSSPFGVVGYVIPRGNPPQLREFQTADEADDWFGSWMGQPYEYVAYFDKRDPSFPSPLNEQASHSVAVSSGFLVPLFAGAAGFGAGYFGPDAYKAAKAMWAKRKAQQQGSGV